MGCCAFNNGKNNFCRLINTNQENIRIIIEEQKTNNITMHNNHNRNNHNRNNIYRNIEPIREIPMRNTISPSPFFVPHFINSRVQNNINQILSLYINQNVISSLQVLNINKSEETNLIKKLCEFKIKNISKLDESNKKYFICLE